MSRARRESARLLAKIPALVKSSACFFCRGRADAIFRETIMTCPQCGRPHDAGSKFCRGCGARFEPVVETTTACVACAAPLKPGARFCKQCGATTAPVNSSQAYVAVDIVEPVRTESSPLPSPEPEPSPESSSVEPVASPRAPGASVAPVAEADPLPAAKNANSMRGIVIAASVVIAVIAIGGLVTWRFLSKDDAATPPPSVSPVAEIAPPTAPATTPAATAPATPAAVVPAPPAPIAQVEAPPAQTSAVDRSPVVAEKPVQVAVTPPAPTPPVEKAVRAKRVPAAQSASAAPMQDVALSLVRKGESAFSRQDYSTAIANARAALDVNPGLARAKQLLDEAQRAQQQAMNSISIQ